MFNWDKKEKPVMGLFGMGGGAASRLVGGASGDHTATGGTKTTSGDFTYHYYTHPDTSGTYPKSPFPASFVSEGSAPKIVDVLLVAGGGGGGSDAGGGGGGGGVIRLLQYELAPGTYNLGVGYGGQQGIGAGTPYTEEDRGVNGGNTTGFNETALGGGGGGRGQGGTDTSATKHGLPGGCGGGGGGAYPADNTQGSGGTGGQPFNSPVAISYGNAGHHGKYVAETGGGGGGAGGSLQDFTPHSGKYNGPENGGDGIRILEFAGIVPNDSADPGGGGFFGGGGGAGGWSSSTSYDGRGGYGGGGNGGGYPGKTNGVVGQNGTDNLGGGGGGGNQQSGGRGGNGCIIVRYLTPVSEGGVGTRNWITVPGPNTGRPAADSGTGYNYFIHGSPGTFNVATAGYAHIMLIAGGGGGGGNNSGGGGAGGIVKHESIYLSAGSYPFTVGGGGSNGAADANAGSKGGNTSIFGLTAEGGGGSGYWNTGNPPSGNGGCGAGGPGAPNGRPAADTTNNTGGAQRTETSGSGLNKGYGNNGGRGYQTSGDIGGGGGGGAGCRGGDIEEQAGNQSGSDGGEGGTGLKTGFIFNQSAIGPMIPSGNRTAFQNAVGNGGFYAGGGGGGTGGSGMPWANGGGSGGRGGGGRGGAQNSPALAQTGAPGIIYTGGGGGGGDNTAGGAGGSGLIIIAWKPNS
mgnify:CR=1 FL=1